MDIWNYVLLLKAFQNYALHKFNLNGLFGFINFIEISKSIKNNFIITEKKPQYVNKRGNKIEQT